MTNAEKFKEVFGYWPEARFEEAMCNFMMCGDEPCKTCKYCKVYGEDEDGLDDKHITWNDEYKAPEPTKN